MVLIPSFAWLILRAACSLGLVVSLLSWIHFTASPQPTKQDISVLVFVVGFIQPILLSLLELLLFYRRSSTCNLRLQELMQDFTDRSSKEIRYSTILELLHEMKSHWRFTDVLADTSPVDHAIDLIELARAKCYRTYSDILPKMLDEICDALLDVVSRGK